MNKKVSKMKRIIWAIEPSPEDESLEKKTSQVIKRLFRESDVSIEPCCYLAVGKMPLEEEESVRMGVDKRLKAYRLPGLLPTHFVPNESSVSMSKKIDLVLKYAKKKSADLVVAQTKARKGLERFFLGSFTETLVLKSKIPILTVNPNAPVRGSRKILFLSDFSEKSMLGFKKVLSLAKDLQTEVVVFHWVSKVSIPIQLESQRSRREADLYTKRLEGDAKLRFKKLESAAQKQKVKVSLVVKSGHGNSADEITKFAGKSKVGMIAMIGSSNATSAALLGSLTRQMVRSSELPVWTIHL